MNHVLSVIDLSIATGDRSARPRTLVDAISFTVDPGERVGIIGESGSGKSLTALAIAGLLPPELKARGGILLRGTEVIGAPEKTLNRLRGSSVALVFQEPRTSLDPLMRVGKQISAPLRRHHGLRGSALRDAVLDRMREVALPEPDRIARSFPYQISGGQRQRVAIAMALACDPVLLIADEPTTALDVTVQAEILDLLTTAVTARGMSLIFVSHDIAVVSKVSDRVLVMRSGTIVETGTVASVISAPRHPYTRQLVVGARALEAALTNGEGPGPARMGESS